MADLTFYTNPQSRGQTARWMLEEIGQPYDTEILGYGTSMKEEPFLSINPMGKVPAIRHRGKVVTEVAAICLYLADAFPEAGLAPALADRADYYRWVFFTAGPVEAAFTNRTMGWQAPAERQAMLGYGTYETAISTLEKAVSARPFIAGDQFTAADLVVGANINFMLMFKMLEPTPAFTEYAARVTDRDAYRRASEIDAALIAEQAATQ
ncbi:MAG: glutathione S-transferase family protein [Sphingomicrobium sp.]